jgi:competence protein ComFC
MNIVSKLREIFLEALFPSKSIERRVRSMDLDDFLPLREVVFDRERNIISLFRYKNLFIREAIRQLKFRRSSRIAKIFAEIIYAEIFEDVSDAFIFENTEKIFLVPVPMSKRERKLRGYNQIELVVEEILKIDRKTFEFDKNILIKVRETERQTELSREKRLKNIKRAFSTNNDVSNKKILLIDDVSTTGTTLMEARKTLEKAGARKILSVTIAR